LKGIRSVKKCTGSKVLNVTYKLYGINFFRHGMFMGEKTPITVENKLTVLIIVIREVTMTAPSCKASAF